jgi:transposase
MKAEEHIAHLERELAAEQAKSARLEAELAAERAEKATLREQMEQILRRLREVEGYLAKDSHNSSKPPSSDSVARKRGKQRQRSGKKTGGQPGHAGRTLLQVVNPDEVVRHRPVVCAHCQQELSAVAGNVTERRQVHDLPEVRLRCRNIRWKRCVARCVGRGTREAFLEA